MDFSDESKTLAAKDTATVVQGAGLSSKEFDEYRLLSEQFTGARLRKVTRKLDLHVLPQLLVLYLLSYIDRSNVGNAKLFGAQQDMKLNAQQWNTGLSVLFATYFAFTTPSNIALKKFGQKIWLPTIMTAVGVVTVLSGLQSNYAGWISFRLLLGAVESGMYAGCTYTLTTWYSPDEQQSRFAAFYAGASLSGAFSGLLAYGIGQLDHTWGYRGWRFIYVIEGLFSTLVGIASFWLIQPSPEKAGRWLTDDERRFLILRHRYSAGGEPGVAEKEGFSWKHAELAFRSFHVYVLALIQFTASTVIYAISFVLPTIINDLGYSAATAQAMTVPPYVFAACTTVLCGWLADRYQKRMLSVLLPGIAAAIGLAIVMSSVRYKSIPGVTLFGCFVMAGGLYPIIPAVTAWTALNLAGSMKRAVGMAGMTSFSVLGGILGSNIYIGTQAPIYPVGFGVSLGMVGTFGTIAPVAYWAILKRINAQRAQIPPAEIAERYGEEQLTEMGDLSPFFRYST